MPDRLISYLSSEEVDREKWDQCINNAPNGLIFSTSIYLDMMADNWHGIVVGDYECVMPVTLRKQWFIQYHYQVPFVAQTGITGNFSNETAKAILHQVLRRVRFGDIVLNFANESLLRFTRAITIPNMVLDLTGQYPHLNKRYHQDLDSNLQRAGRSKLSYVNDNNIKLAINLFRKLYASKLKGVREVDYERFTGLCLHLHKMNKAFVRKVTDVNGKIMCIALLLHDGRRIYNIVNAVLPEGKRKSANHFLFDQLIREFAGSGVVLDFEGSQRAGIRKFYESFGAVNQPCFWVKRRLV